MRRSRSIGPALALLLGSAVAASAELLPWEGELRLELVAASLPPLVLTGGGMASVNASSGGSHLESVRLAGGIAGGATLPVTDPEVTAGGIVALGVEASLGTATLGFGSTASGRAILTRSTLPVAGLARLCLFDPACLPGGALPLPLGDGSAGLGVGGLLTAGGGGPWRISLLASPWTLGTALVDVATDNGARVVVPAAGWRHGAVSFTTSTALPSGAFSVVTPVRIEASDGLELAGFGLLQLRFAPEPARLALLASGLAGLGGLARLRCARPRGRR